MCHYISDTKVSFYIRHKSVNSRKKQIYFNRHKSVNKKFNSRHKSVNSRTRKYFKADTKVSFLERQLVKFK